MAFFAPHVRRGDFLYSSILYACVGTGNQHPRASVAELANLLRPQAVSFSNTKAKDQVWHWYAAQLIHYGLPTTKNKNVAKVRLLNALNSFKLEVPTWILRDEEELRVEWERENVKMKKGAKSWKAGAGHLSKTSGASGLGTPRGVSVSVSVSIANGVDINITPTSTPGKRKRAVHDTDTPKTKSIKTKSTKTKPATTTKTVPTPLNAAPPGAKKASPPLLQPTTTRTRPTPPKLRVKLEHPSTPSPQGHGHVKQEHGSQCQRGYTSSSPPPVLLSGKYSLTTDTTTTEMTLYLSSSPTNPLWWATLTLHPLTILICMNPGPTPDRLGHPCTLGWRTRDLETGDLRFGKACTGEMTFYGDYEGINVSGALYGLPRLGDVQIWGERMGGGRQVGNFQEEWDDFPREAYGRW